MLHHVARRRGLFGAIETALVNPAIGLWIDNVENDVVTIDGLTYDLNGESISIFTKGSIARGKHEREERSFIEEYLPEQTDVIELGAGVGYLTALAANRVTGNVIAVEANPRLIPVLEKTRETNDLEYEIVNAAYTGATEEIEFPLSTNYKFSSVHKESEHTVTVPGTSLEELVSSHDIENCALIVDVEGNEVDLVREELPILEEVCDWLLIEYHSSITGREEAEVTKQRLKEGGFSAVGHRQGVVLYRKDPNAQRSGR